MMLSLSCIACMLSLQVDHSLLGAPRVLRRGNVERALEWGKCGDREQKRSKKVFWWCILREIINCSTNALFARLCVWLSRFAIDRFVPTSSTTLDQSQTTFTKIASRWSSNCNARPDEAMASSDTPAVKRSGKVRNKRFVQPVLPALPQIPNTKKSDDIGTYQADHTVNGVTQETLEQGSERASPPALLDLPNGAHKDNIKEASGNGTHIETDMSPVVPSPALQNGRSAPAITPL